MELAAEAEVGDKAMLRAKAIARTGCMREMVAMRVVNRKGQSPTPDTSDKNVTTYYQRQFF